MFSYFVSRIANTKIVSGVALGLAILRHAHLLKPLLLARRASALGRYIRARPEIIEIVYGRFISANWDAATKVNTAISHVETVEAIGGALSAEADVVTDLIELPEGYDYRISLDQPRWLLKEGQLALSLWEGPDRIFSVSFSLRADAAGRNAFIGGIQGRRQVQDEEDVLERYRRFTKCAHGVRPRDFILEVFKVFCKVIGVNHILAVAQDNHPLSGKSDGFTLAYNEIWQERGGQYDGHGFYALPLGFSTRAEDEIPAKKRSQYRKRSAMFLDIEDRLSERLVKQRLERPPPKGELQQGDVRSLDTLLRFLAYAGAIFVLASTNFMGGTWIGFAAGLAFVHASYWILKGNIPKRAGERIELLAQLRRSSLAVRAGLAMTLLALGVVVDIQLDADRALGRIFKIYLIIVFISSLCLGTRVTLIVGAVCLMALNYLHLPPRYSFAISSWQEILDLLTFGAMATVVLVIPRLLLASIKLSAFKRRG
ncbi:DUF535 family protein [Bradyrhizobium japonicum]|uniref:DUF535 family protein n=1 Tax=Bradyrhizobium japonicum TaxID=375 RepID=UPI001BA9380F|nr:DUF535 family protein [Bradyrhizobium japonicum]MBR0995468.1 DUF535 family protein [Bradyrhizobium japonicum]